MRTSWVLLLSLSILSLLITPSTGLFRPRLATPVRVPLGHHTSSLPSEPVYLNDYSTPEAAQAASRVHLPSASPFISEQYAGYVTVNKTCGSNMFWWFFGAQDGNASAPLLMWLNGGPGSSSLYGLFEEMGPFTASPDGQSVLPRNTTWNAHYAMLFVDNPVGTGFSYTEDPSCYAENMDDVAVNLYALLTGFFTAFPAYLSNPFYVCGESYGGKYAPSIAYYIHDQNLRNPPIRINLAGMSVGDGLMDPLTQIPGYGQLLFNEGMASRAELAYWEDREAAIVQALRAGQNDTAFAIFDYMLNGDFYAFPTYYRNTTGLTDYFNIDQPTYVSSPFDVFLNLNSTRTAIHVGSHPFWSYNRSVELALIHDWFRSVGWKLPTLLDSYRVLIYNGQRDIILSAPQCQNFLHSLQWSGSKQWQQARKVVWKVNQGDEQPAGYVQQYGSFSYAIVRGAGHLLPQDQGVRALSMITRFVDGLGWE